MAQTVQVKDLMSERVVYATAHQTVGHLKTLFKNNKISIIPVVDDELHVIGIVSTKELVADVEEHWKVEKIMTKNVYTIA